MAGLAVMTRRGSGFLAAEIAHERGGRITLKLGKGDRSFEVPFRCFLRAKHDPFAVDDIVGRQVNGQKYSSPRLDVRLGPAQEPAAGNVESGGSHLRLASEAELDELTDLESRCPAPFRCHNAPLRQLQLE